ncbi:mitochondrial transcription rescue factor 1 [Rhinoraja longicauda]
MNGLISPVAGMLRVSRTCVAAWRRCASRELCVARGLRCIGANISPSSGLVEQKPTRHSVLHAFRADRLPDVFIRHKSSKKNRKMPTQEEEEEEEEEEGSGSEDESAKEEEVDVQPKTYKDLEKVVASFRFDLVMKAGLDMARNKVEDAFYSDKLKLNGERLLKKSKVVKEGDILDHIIGEDKEAETVTVMRVMLRKVAGEMTDSDKYRVTLRRWKHLTLPRSDVYK